MKSVIEHIKGQKPGSPEHLVHIYGVRDIPKPDWYKHTKTGQEFSYIAGSLAWPGPNHAAGVGLIVGVSRTDKANPPFLALDEVSNADPQGLILDCLKLRQKWGWQKGLDILKCWTGDAERYSAFSSGINASLVKRGGPAAGFFIVSPIHFDRNNHFALYIHRIGILRRTKRLSLGSCKALKGHLTALPPDATEQKGENFPAVFALGALLHTLIATRPWQAHVGVRELFPTVPAHLDYAGYAAKQEELAWKALFGEAEEMD